MNSDRADFPAHRGALRCPVAQTTMLAHLSNPLAALDESTRQRLVNWLLRPDAELRSYVEPILGVPQQFEYPVVGVG
jgi:hypothetical protein